MRISVVGAGIAGLACARELTRRGHEVVVFEKSRGPGGRVATRGHDGFVWDTGATTITPRGKRLAGAMAELPQDELVRIDRPVYLHENLRITPGDAGRKAERFTYRSGNVHLARLLANGLDLRTEVTVERLDPAPDGISVNGETFTAAVLTPPMPQSCAILWRRGYDRPVAGARYRACLSIGLGYPAPTPETPYAALIDPDQMHPMVWLSLESAKSPGRAPEGGSAFVVQMSRLASVDRWRDSDEALVQAAARYVAQIYGPEYRVPIASTVMRWKYSQPEGFVDFELANPPERIREERVVLAGDSLMGGHVEDAYEVGARAADRLIETFS